MAISAVLGLLGMAALQAAEPLIAEMQRVEASRNAAIRNGDAAALERLYAADFRGISAGGRTVDRAELLAILHLNAHANNEVESVVTSAREIGGVVLVEGRLRITWPTRRERVYDSLYLHVFRRNGDHWEMVAGAASAAPRPAS